jgi:hypothetical protein
MRLTTIRRKLRNSIAPPVRFWALFGAILLVSIFCIVVTTAVLGQDSSQNASVNVVETAPEVTPSEHLRLDRDAEQVDDPSLPDHSYLNSDWSSQDVAPNLVVDRCITCCKLCLTLILAISLIATILQRKFRLRRVTSIHYATAALKLVTIAALLITLCLLFRRH